MKTTNRWLDALPLDRFYVYDFETGEELFAGAWLAFGGWAVKDGVRYRDTTTFIDAVDLRTRDRVELTAESFQGRRVVIKQWYAPRSGEQTRGAVEWFLLIAPGRVGWREANGNDPCVYGLIGAQEVCRRKFARAC